MMYLALSYTTVSWMARKRFTFLVRVRDCIERTPMRLLLGT